MQTTKDRCLKEADAEWSSVSSPAFEELMMRLRMQAAALSGIVRMIDVPMNSSPKMLLDALNFYGQAMDIGQTLKTIARTHLALNASDGNANVARSHVQRILREIDEMVAPLLSALLDSAPDGIEQEDRAVFRAWHLLAEARGRAPTEKKDLPLKNFIDAVQSDVFEPLLSLHTHLTSTMSIEVVTAEGAKRQQSFGTSIAVLKSSDDPVLRRSTFEGMNSWMASHASSFADLLNAVTGFRLHRLALESRSMTLESLYASAFRSERTRLDVFQAMMSAIDEVRELLRDAVRLRAQAVDADPMRVAHLLCPRPEERYASGICYESMRSDWQRAFATSAPDFADFVKRAHEEGWVNSQSLSMKAGGGWCDDLPVFRAVRIVASYFPNRTGEAQLTHLLGVGWLHKVLHDAGAAERQVPLSILEMAGNAYETMLVRQLYEEQIKLGGDGICSLLWQMLQRLSNLLLTVPARHRLLRNIYAERLHGVVSASRLNELSDEAWRHYYGDATRETDRYVWVYKGHFYRQGTIFYDWQYAFGFLLSQLLVKRFALAGRTASGDGLEKLWRDAGSMTTFDLIVKHIGGDPRTIEFWRGALAEALWPVEAFRQLKGGA